MTEQPENTAKPENTVEALVPRGKGHRFVFYGDACSGVAGKPHAATFAATNAVVAKLAAAPEFVIFAGDEIVGLTTDEAELRRQWHYWLDVEMAWLDQNQIPLYNTTSNHTTYDAMSETVFADVLDHLPRNGPPGQEGLSYYVRRDDLVLVAVNTSWSQLGGEGHVETDWLDSVLQQHADARYKLVVGHHPVFPVNGFAGQHQRELGAEDGARLWETLVRHKVMAYLCSHILAFDVQVHDDVLQIVSAGAGTAHRMPEEVEYLHFVQAAIDERGLRYQVLDQLGAVREQLSWPLRFEPSGLWATLRESHSTPPSDSDSDSDHGGATPVIGLRLRGHAAGGDDGAPQTLLSTRPEASALPTIWIGLTGRSPRLTVTIGPRQGRSPHYWFGPELESGQPFDFQMALHFGMGPGGVLHRTDDDAPWSSLTSSSPWGLERNIGPQAWTIGHIAGSLPAAEFRGESLTISCGFPAQNASAQKERRI